MMKVKINGKIYDSEHDPIMVMFSEEEKKSVTDMEETKYCFAPEKYSKKDIDEIMANEEENIFFNVGEEEYCDEEIAISRLLEEGILFCNTREYVCSFEGNKKEPTIVLFMLCNDVFAWATADAECLTTDDLPELYKMWQADKRWGDTKWVCKKRNMKPQKPIIRDMKKEGAWDEDMENLPENEFGE